MRKIGQQEPRIRYCPDYVYSDGDDCCDLARHYGLDMDKWQRNTITDWLGRDENDDFTAMSAGLSLPRQNGKNAALEARELYGLSVLGDTILHTAHEVRTARESFLRLCSFFENKRKYPELYKICKTIRKANGQEMIECEWQTEDGEIMSSKIMFMARSRGAARGFSVDMVVFDEAQELQHEQIEAMLPTLSASKKQIQIIYTGTPPTRAGMGEAFVNVRRSALEEKDKTLCWHEWGVTEIGDVFDRDRWYEANPAMGIRIREDFTEKELYGMTEEGFARERLGWWSDYSMMADIPIKTEMWNEHAVEIPANDGVVSFGVKFATDGTAAAISACSRVRNEGEERVYGYHVELAYLINGKDTLREIIDFLADVGNNSAEIIIDSKTFAEDIRARIIDRGVKKSVIIIANTNDVADACSWFTSAINNENGDLTHFKNDGQAALDKAATTCPRRDIGKEGRFGFNDSTQGNAFVVESAALAYYASRTAKRNPHRKQKVKCYQ